MYALISILFFGAGLVARFTLSSTDAWLAYIASGIFAIADILYSNFKNKG